MQCYNAVCRKTDFAGIRKRQRGRHRPQAGISIMDQRNRLTEIRKFQLNSAERDRHISRQGGILYETSKTVDRKFYRGNRH